MRIVLGIPGSPEVPYGLLCGRLRILRDLLRRQLRSYRRRPGLTTDFSDGQDLVGLVRWGFEALERVLVVGPQGGIFTFDRVFTGFSVCATHNPVIEGAIL
ncbi:hypothetical protein DAD186_03890 [Dermabacter vaginalis]|uniref:Uncharacterized protein n=1 Tax=Dermabacter vaginalis TaxID=1630135 RepID=A0A1B0ZG68_9MICO|nr:hypothetical protein DAD186_03890 [Dermabacter vaginalis]